jgi:CRISPR/Cas system-associated endoribonuclease Cas2
MFQDLLEQLSKISVALNGRIEEDGDQIINTMIFGKNFSGDVFEYKKKYFRKLRLKEAQLLRIQQSVYAAGLTQQHLSILLQEIENRLLKIEFLRYIYNTEAQKIDERMQVYYPYSIEIYNKAFFGVTKKNLGDDIMLEQSYKHESIYKKFELLALIKKAKEYCPELVFKF